MDGQKKLQLAQVEIQNSNQNNVFASMSLEELCAALDLILQAETIARDEFYEDRDRQARFLH